jgi:hypothetical protein
MADNQDNPGIRVPPPLIHLLPHVLRLLLDRRAQRPRGWPNMCSQTATGSRVP